MHRCIELYKKINTRMDLKLLLIFLQRKKIRNAIVPGASVSVFFLLFQIKNQ